MSQIELPPGGGESGSRTHGFLKRAGVGLLAPALVALALGAVPAAAQAATTGDISGSFTVPSGTLAPGDVTIQLVDRNGSVVRLGTGDEVVTPTSGTAANYTITGIAPGQYYVYFNDTTTGDNVAPDYHGDNGADNINKATLVTVPATGGAQSLATDALATGATITGSVTDANAAAETATTVSVTPVDATSDPDPVLADGITTSVTGGAYTISGLPTGTYTLSYDASGASFGLNADVDGTGLTYDFGSATQYALTTGASTTASFTVPAVGGISGKVTDSSGNALSGVTPAVFDAAGNAVAYGTTAVDGTYTVADLLPGSYRVEFEGLSASDLSATFYGGSTLAAATAVAVSSGATTANINGSLSAGATVSGTLTAAQGGAALGGLAVELVDAQGNVMDYTYTNTNGSYTLNNVPAGTWYLEFLGGHAYNGSYYATEYYRGQSTLAGSAALKITAGETLTGVNQALMAASTTLPGMPKVSIGRLSGLSTNKVALSFRLTAGAGTAGYLDSFSIKLPKAVSWNRAALKKDIVIPGDKYTYAIKSGRLVITFTGGKKVVNFRIKAGGIKVSKAIEANAKKRRIASEAINLTVTDTTGKATTASFTVKKPH